MTRIVNNDKLSFVLTTYGLRRVREAINNKDVILNLAKAKVGNGDNESFYTPSEQQTELKGYLKKGTFDIVEKDLLEDDYGQNRAVSFLFKVPNSFDNCDIREVGLYELTPQNEEILFAVGTQQPIVKPSVSDNYLIFVDYYIILKSANLADVYEQIKVDPYNKVVTKEDLYKLMSALLFTQGNLSEQIGMNSHLIGLNRGTLLFDRMQQNLENYGNSLLVRTFGSLTNFVQSKNLYGYWLFNYSKFLSDNYSLVNLCDGKENLSCNQAVNNYLTKRVGLLPSLTFGEEDYYYLSNEIPFYLSDIDSGEDIPFSMMFAIEPLHYETFNYESPEHYVDSYMDKWKVIRSTLVEGADRTLLARSNYSSGSHSFEVIETSDNALQIKLFSDSSNYLTFTTEPDIIPNERHTVIISYDNNNHTFLAYVNNTQVFFTKTETGNYTFMSNAPSSFYGYKYVDGGTIYKIWSDDTSNPKILYETEGKIYKGTEWTISSNHIYYNGNMATYDSTLDYTLPTSSICSYIIDEYGHRSKNIDSNVCLVGIVKGQALTKEQMRMLALNLTSAIGLNPCLYL